jgi:NAD(P)-dependent dehydrogenase (short-subunit alcohol dehydrogenase family)
VTDTPIDPSVPAAAPPDHDPRPEDVLDMFRLDGGVAVVTGGGTGIGRAIALGLAGAGCDVVLAGRRPEPLAAVAAEVEATGRAALVVPTDVTVREELDRLAAAAVERFGAVSVWVNNAGGLQGEPMRVLTEVTEDSWHTIVDRNFTAVWLASAVAQGAVRDGGAIINVASTGGLSKGSPGHGVYTAAKAAVIHLTRTLALECASRRIRVNALAPGHTRTADYDSASGFGDAQYAKLATKQPLGRLGRDADFAAAAVYLGSAASSWVTGQVLVISGAP